jgi:hypothetical protein
MVPEAIDLRETNGALEMNGGTDYVHNKDSEVICPCTHWRWDLLRNEVVESMAMGT